MIRTLLAILALAALSGCAGFTLGTVLYCAKDTACDAKVSPFRPVEAVPVATAGSTSGAALPLVKPSP